MSWLLRGVKLGGWETAVATSEAQMSTLCQQNPGALFGAIAISTLTWGVMIVEFYAMASFLGLSLSLAQLIALLTAARVAYLLPLPGGLGTLEASQVWALGLMGFNPAVGLGLSLVIRLRDVSLGLLGLWWMGQRLKMVWLRP